MNTKIFAYNNASELARLLQSIKADNLRFVIPSRKDKFFFPLREYYHDLWTWQEIYDDIITQSGQEKKFPFSPPDHLLILKSILADTISEYKEKIIDFPGISRAGFLDVISDDIRELMNEAVLPEKLPHNPESNKPSEFLLPEVYSRYVKYLNDYHLLDSAEVYTESLEAMKHNQEWGKNLVIVFTGFLSFTHGQFELVKALEERCREVIIIKPEANLERFHDAASQFGKVIHAQKSSGRIIELNITEPGLEPEMIARSLALWSAGELENWGEFPGFDSIGLMLSQGREESFAQAFRRYGVPYDFMSGIPISQTLPGKILASIRNLDTRSFPTYETALLLTQKCFAGISFPVMNAYVAGRTGLDSWEEYLASNEGEVFDDALKTIRAIRKFCGVLAVKNTPLRAMRAFHDFLKTPGLWLDREDKISDFPELDETVRLTASAIETIEHKLLSLEELMPDLGAVQDAKFDSKESYDFLENWCKNTNTRAPVQISNAVRIFTGQPPVLAAFPVFIMTGITQKTWSGNMTSSPLLGNDERIELKEFDAHLPTSSEKAQQREAVFRRLIHTGEKLTLISRPLLDNEGRPVAESPFMQRFRDEMTDWNIKKAKNEPEGINILLGGDNFTFPEIDAEEKISRSSPVINKSAGAVGASDIRELLLCPFLWWQKRQANIYERDSELASQIDWGNMLHKYWECVWKNYSIDMTADGSIFTLLANQEWRKLSGKDEAEDYEKFHRLVTDSRLKRKLDSLHFRVQRLAEVQAAILDGLHKDGWVHKEILLEENAHVKVKTEGVTFLGQCDRIEILTNPDGAETAFIVDYKTGTGESYENTTKISRYWWNTKQLASFSRGIQLSVYAALFERCDLSGVYILGLESGKISGTVKNNAKNIFSPYASKKFDGDIQRRINEGNYAMKCAVRILERGKFLPEYDCDLCKLCSIKSLCRKGEFKGEIIADNETTADSD